MPLLTRKKVLTAEPHRVAALPAGIGNGTAAENIPLDAVATIDAERIDRNFATASLTAIKDLAGQKAVDFTFGLEMRGSNNGTSEAEWAKVLQSCGFQSEAIESMDIGAISAGTAGSTTFRHLEKITGSVTGTTATVVMDTHNGASEIYFFNETGAGFNGTEDITGSDSDASATTSSSPSSEGYAYWPASQVEKVILFDATGLTDAVAAGDLIAGVTSGARGIVTEAVSPSTNTVVEYRPVRGTFVAGETMQRISPNADADIGSLNASNTGESFDAMPPLALRLYTDGKSITGRQCRGNVSFNLEVNRPVRMDFTFRGTLDSVADAPLLTGIDYENTDPPLWETSSIGYADNETAADQAESAELDPCLKTLAIDMGNQLVDRKCAGAEDGLVEVYISARDGSGTMNVEDALEADIGWLTRIQDNQCVRLRCSVGATDGNRFTFSMPGIQFTQHSEGDTDGIVTQDMTFRLTGGNLFDLATPTDLTSIGGDNELVLVYHTS